MCAQDPGLAEVGDGSQCQHTFWGVLSLSLSLIKERKKETSLESLHNEKALIEKLQTLLGNLQKILERLPNDQR